MYYINLEVYIISGCCSSICKYNFFLVTKNLKAFEIDAAALWFTFTISITLCSYGFNSNSPKMAMTIIAATKVPQNAVNIQVILPKNVKGDTLP